MELPYPGHDLGRPSSDRRVVASAYITDDQAVVLALRSCSDHNYEIMYLSLDYGNTTLIATAENIHEAVAIFKDHGGE